MVCWGEKEIKDRGGVKTMLTMIHDAPRYIGFDC